MSLTITFTERLYFLGPKGPHHPLNGQYRVEIAFEHYFCCCYDDDYFRVFYNIISNTV